MAILNLNTNSTSGSSIGAVASDAAMPLAKGAARPSADQSAIVSLSVQGQQLSRTAASVQTNQNSVGTPSSENVEAKPKEAIESQGVQLLEGESKRGRISTYA